MIIAFLMAGNAICVAVDYEITEKIDTITVESSAYAAEHHSQMVKILTEEGAAYREVLAVNPEIQIKNVSCAVTCPGEQTVKMKPEDFVELPVSQSAQWLSDYKALVVAPSKLARGCTVRLDYDRNVTSLLYIDPWVYATSVPVRRATCSISYPATVPLKYRSDTAGIKVQKSESAGKTTLLFESGDQKEIVLHGRSESFGSVEKKVVFLPDQCTTDRWLLNTKSWQDIASWFLELSKFAYKEDPGMDAVVKEVKAANTDPEKIAEALYVYIQKNYVYTAIEVGIGGYKPRFANQTFQKKYGDCKDLTLLYLTLLKKAGIEGYPALVDTRSSKFFYRDFPSPQQFNHCIAFLPAIRNGTWVDSTVKNFRLGEIPAAIQGKYALIAGGSNELRQIPEDFFASNVVKLSLSGVYSDTGVKWNGEVQTLGEASMLVDSMQDALLKSRIQYYVYSTLLESGLPVQSVKTTPDGERSLRLEFSTPVQQMQTYGIFLINAMKYQALDNLAVDPDAGHFFALGTPVRLVIEASADVNGRSLVSSPVHEENKGQYVRYKLDLSEEGGKIRYLADAFFVNGFLDDVEMKQYQKELREFASLIQRTVVIK